MRLYDDLSPWYTALTPLDDYEEEATAYEAMIRAVLGPGPHTLLELGCGAGHNAHFLGRSFELCLVDRAPAMLDLAARLHPRSPLIEGDMRTVRLGRAFDVVFVHDALAYLLTEEDVDRCLATVRAHLRPGGVALLAPDDVAEGLELGTEHGEGAHGGRAVRYIEWSRHNSSRPYGITVDYAIALRDGDEPVRVEHDRHEVSAFPRALWHELMEKNGLLRHDVERPAPYERYPIFLGVAR